MSRLREFCFILALCAAACVVQSAEDHLDCEEINELSGVISDVSIPPHHKCWVIKVPERCYAFLDLISLATIFHYDGCEASILIKVDGATKEHVFCSKDEYWNPVFALGDATIIYYHEMKDAAYPSSFELKYDIETVVCVEKDHFRCSSHFCVHNHQICDGVKDCESGADENECERRIVDVNGVNVTRAAAVDWLKSQRLASYGWGKNTHRAAIALYLSNEATFSGDSLEEELTAKQLELQMLVALVRNSTDPLSINELSMFVNALFVTCRNPRQFYGHDLLQILGERVAASEELHPGAYLSLCCGNWPLSESRIQKLAELLLTYEYAFNLDIYAMTLMALTCIKKKHNVYKTAFNDSTLYNRAIEEIVQSQQPDGSFGNVYTTALITQALLSSGPKNTTWNFRSTAEYLVEQLNAKMDFLSAYLVLPVFSSRSMLDMANMKCPNLTKPNKDEISDITSRLEANMRIQYSLFVGDLKDVIHTIFLKVPKNSSAYDIMRIAQAADSKYRISCKEMPGYMYVYEIAGITNDPEAGIFWFLYTEDHENGKFVRKLKSPDKFHLKEGEHLIMWYKTVHLRGKKKGSKLACRAQKQDSVFGMWKS